MKPIVKQILLYLFIFSINISLSQTSITNKDYNVTDDVVKVEVYDYYNTSSRIEYSSISTFQNGFIQKQLNDGAVYIIAGNSDKTYSYSNFNKEFKINNNEYIVFEFAGVKFSCSKNGYKVLKQSPNNLEYQYDLVGKLIHEKYNLTKDNLIEITAPDLWFEIKTYYNKNGQLVRRTKSKSNSIQEEKRYSYDNNGLIEKIIIENFTENSITEKHYEYELDEKGNWIKRIEYEIIPNAFDNKTFSTRKLTYKNGEITGGYLDYNNDNFFSINPAYFEFEHPDDKVKDCISGDCQNGFGKKTFNEKDIYEGNFSVGLMSGKGTYTYANGNKYEGDFKSGYINGQGKLTFANGDVYEGTFFKNQISGLGTYTFKNGDKYVGNWVKGYQDGKCTFYDYKANIKQEAIYKEGKVVEVLNKVAISETNPPNKTGITWTKNAANTEYWLYNNGVLKEGQTFWVGNSLYVHMQQTKELYFLENFKTQTAGPSHAGVLLPFKTINGFWYKNNAGGATAYNNKCEEIKNLEVYKYTTNGIDVLLKGKAESETLLLKNFKTAEVNKIYPSEIYKENTAAQSNKTIEKKELLPEIADCKTQKDEAICLSQKISDEVKAMQAKGNTQSEIDAVIKTKVGVIANYNIELLYNVLMKIDRNELKYLQQSIKSLPQHQQNKIKEFAQKKIDTYTKQQNEYQNRNKN